MTTIPHPVSLALLACAALGGAALAADPVHFPQKATIEGDGVSGVGLVTRVDRVAVDTQGRTIVEVDTDHALTDADTAILEDGTLAYREGQALVAPLFATINSFGAPSVDSDGHVGWNLFLGNLTTTTDSGIFRDDKLVLQEGTISTSPAFSAGTPYIGFFRSHLIDADRMLVVASIDDPAIATTVDRALVILNLDAAGNLVSENVLVKEGDILPGQASPLSEIGTGPHDFAFSEAGDVLYVADTTAATTVDGAIYRNSTVIAQEGQPSPVIGRTWLSVGSSRLDLSGNGQHTIFQGQLSAPTTDDQLIVLDGAKLVQEGDSHAAIAPFTFTAFGTGALAVADDGVPVWVGDWNDPNTAKDVGLFVGSELVLQEGVSEIDGLLVESISTVESNFATSSDGRFVIFEATLAGGLNGAFVFDRAWRNLGHAKAGVNGLPKLAGSGLLEPATEIRLELSQARPNAVTAIVIGLNAAYAPYLGGTLVPTPDVVIVGFPTSPSGGMLLLGNWPGAPSGFSFVTQILIQDPAGIAGVAMSNAVRATVP